MRRTNWPKVAEFLVHLVVGQPEGDLGDAGGEFLDLDAVHLVDVDEGEVVDVLEGHLALNELLVVAVEFLEDVEFEAADFAVGDDEEVAAAAGGIEKRRAARRFCSSVRRSLRPGGAVFADGVELGAEVVEEEGADEFEDVGLGGVVGADLAALAGVHDALEEEPKTAGLMRSQRKWAAARRAARMAVLKSANSSFSSKRWPLT
jgi:SAM-dependent methyltransferase